MNTRTAIISAPILAAVGMLALLMFIMVGAAGSQSSGTLPSSTALADIPPDYLQDYIAAGAKYHTEWWVLAGIGKVETDHGRLNAPGVTSGVNSYGCCAGPMQFAVSAAAGCRVCVGDTWGAYGVDGNGDGMKNVYDPADAIPAAARYTNSNGAPKDWHRAILAYNHSEAYYQSVMGWANKYRQDAALTPLVGAATPEQVASNPNIHFWHACEHTDILSAQIDPRILTALETIAQTHKIGIFALKCDHGVLTDSGNLSNHSAGRAADISDVDGEVCTGTRDGNCGRLAVQIAQWTGPLHSTELIYCFDPDGPASPDAFADAGHCNHVHLGYDA